MTTFTVTVGWTQTDRSNDYVPSSDGYHPGARQHRESFEVEWTNSPWSVPVDVDLLAAIGRTAEDQIADQIKRTTETLAEVFFYACDPGPRLSNPSGITGQVCDLIRERAMKIVLGASRVDLRIGDTITVSGGELFPETTVECQRVGWKLVDLQADEREAHAMMVAEDA